MDTTENSAPTTISNIPDAVNAQEHKGFVHVEPSKKIQMEQPVAHVANPITCLLYTSPSPRD